MEENRYPVFEEIFTIHDLICGALIVGVLLMGYFSTNAIVAMILTNLAVFLILFLWFFLSFNIFFGKDSLVLFFNIPFMEKEIPYEDIESCRIVKGNWLKRISKNRKKYSFPLGISPNKEVIEIRFKNKNKKTLVIGVKDVHTLHNLIEKQITLFNTGFRKNRTKRATPIFP